MVKKKKAKTRSEAGPRKAASKKAAKKARVKSAPKKKTVKKSAKKTAGKRTAGKAAAKRPSTPRQRAPKKVVEKLVLPVEPGPPPGGIPPVEEPMRQEEAIGIVTHYYSHLGVGVVQVNKGSLRTGDTIHVKGHSTDFTQTVESMEYEHRHTDQAGAGQSVGLKVVDHAREHDIVYLVK
jgi:putative protease